MLGIAVVAAAVAPASAETKADALFKKGKKQLAEKKYAEACATFEKVDNLDPGIGAKLNVARCFEEWGKLARAYRWYADAERMATTTEDKRAPKIKELAEALDADVPRLTIKLPDGSDPAAVAIKLDGAALALDVIGKEQRVDPGPHQIEFLAGTEHKTKTVPLERGGSTEVTLEVPKSTGKPKPTPAIVVSPTRPGDGTPHTQPPAKRGDAGRTRRIAGLATAGAGVLGMGIAGIVTLGARSSYRRALDEHCMGATDQCDDVGVKLTHDARSRANAATVVTILGVAAVAGGVVLYVTAPKRGHREEHARYLAPAIGSDGAAIVFGGGF
jgi:hypothetical protein